MSRLSRFGRGVVETLRRDFVAGLLVIVPVGFTILAVLWGVRQVDNLALPRLFAFLGFDAPPRLVGFIVTLSLIVLAGALTRSFLGRALIRLWERIIDRVPVARSLYSVVKQFMEAVFGSSSREGFRRVVLLEYPRRGVWCYAFTTGKVAQSIPDLPRDLVKIFIPSTPNPTTGYFLLVPDSELLETGLSVEEAFKLIISAGIAHEPEVRVAAAGLPRDAAARIAAEAMPESGR